MEKKITPKESLSVLYFIYYQHKREICTFLNQFHSNIYQKQKSKWKRKLPQKNLFLFCISFTINTDEKVVIF